MTAEIKCWLTRSKTASSVCLRYDDINLYVQVVRFLAEVNVRIEELR